MNTYEDFMEMARRAHADGNTEAAARFVARAKALKSSGGDVVATTSDGGKITRLPDGKLAFSSPGYSTNDQDAIKRIMEGDTVKEVVQSSTDRMTIAQNPVAARVNEFNRGAPFVGSYLDEAVGLLAPEAGQAMRQTSEAMQRERPVETGLLNMAGSVAYTAPLAVAGGPTVMRAAPRSTTGRVMAGAGAGTVAGGTEGTIYGYGEGTGSERLQNAGEFGAIGAGMGGLAGMVLPFGADMVQNLIQRYKRTDVDQIASQFGISRNAAKVLKQAFENNDQTAVQRILRAGDEATLADAGRSGAALLDAAAATGGTPLNIVDNAVSQRSARTNASFVQALDDVLGEVRGPRAAAREIAEQTAPARTAAYRAAENTPIDYSTGAPGERILSILNGIEPRTLQSAIDEANAQLRWQASKGEPVARQILASIGEDGSVRFGELPNVRQLDELKKALQTLDQNARDNFGRTTNGGLFGEQARAVRDATVEATGGPSGTYANALSVGQGKIQMDRGLELGLNMLRNTNQTTREMVGEALAGMPQDARMMVKTGLRSYIDDLMGRVGIIASDPDGQEARQTMAALRELTSDNARDKLRVLLGPDEFNRLMPEIDKAVSTQGMRASVATNSKTAVRSAIQGSVDDVTAPGPLGTLARGEPVDATKRLTQVLMDTTPEMDALRKEQLWSEIATVLSERRGNRSAQAALDMINRAIAGQPLSEAEARLIANQAVLAIGASGGQSGTRVLATQ